MTFSKIRAGWYATPDGTYAVVSDGLPVGRNWPADTPVDQRADENSYQGGEWAAVHDPEGRLREDHNAGENLDWYPKMADAVIGAMEHKEANQVRS